MPMPFDLSGFDMDPEFMKYLTGMMSLSQQGADLQQKAYQPYYQAADAARGEASRAQQQFSDALSAPAERPPIAESGLMRGMSSLAELLSPGKGYGAKGMADIKERETSLAARRVERLKMLEKASDEAAKRAQTMGDNKLYMQSLKDGERYAKMAEEIGQTVGGIHKLNVESRNRQREAHSKFLDDLALEANKFRLSIAEKYGLDPSNASPEQMQAARMAYKIYDADVQSILQAQKSGGDSFNGDPEEARRQAVAALGVASQNLQTTLMGTAAPSPQPQSDGVEESIKTAIQKGYSRSETKKELRKMVKNGKIEGVPAELFMQEVDRQFSKVEPIHRRIEEIDRKLSYLPRDSAARASFAKEREQLAKQLYNMFGYEVPSRNNPSYGIDVNGYLVQ